MNIHDDDLVPGQPEDREPTIAQLFSELFVLANRAVDRITDDEVDERLHRALDSARTDDLADDGTNSTMQDSHTRGPRQRYRYLKRQKISAPRPISQVTPGGPAGPIDPVARRRRRIAGLLALLAVPLLLSLLLASWPQEADESHPAAGSGAPGVAGIVLAGPRGPSCLRLVLANDVSGSMSDYAMAREQAMTALLNWLPKNLRSDDEIAVIDFAETAATKMPPTKVSTLVSGNTLASGGAMDGSYTWFTPVLTQMDSWPKTNCDIALVLLSDAQIVLSAENDNPTSLPADADAGRQLVQEHNIHDVRLLVPDPNGYRSVGVGEDAEDGHDCEVFSLNSGLWQVQPSVSYFVHRFRQMATPARLTSLVCLQLSHRDATMVAAWQRASWDDPIIEQLDQQRPGNPQVYGRLIRCQLVISIRCDDTYPTTRGLLMHGTQQHLEHCLRNLDLLPVHNKHRRAVPHGADRPFHRTLEPRRCLARRNIWSRQLENDVCGSHGSSFIRTPSVRHICSI
jgi:hypothetical protein